jgi:RNA polymerase-binding transcription factor DksA
MAKKIDNKKKDKKAKPASKPIKKAAKPVAKKPAKAASKPSSKVVAKATKPAKKSAAKPVAKKVVKPIPKKAVKPAPKKVSPPVTKKNSATAKKVVAKPEPKATKPVAKTKEVSVKKSTTKPIDAIAKKGKAAKSGKADSKKKSKKGEDDEEDDIPEEEENDEDVDVKDDYDKPDDDDAVIDGGLDEAGLIDLEGGPPDIDEDDDEIPEKRGRGRRKKNEGKSSGGSMEAYIRNRPLQIDINKPLIKKGLVEAPKPFVNNDDKRTRYSDKELAEFKELILEKLKEAQMDYDLLKQTLSNEDNHGTDDTSPSFKLLEDGSDVMSKEETAQLASRQEKYIVNLKNALVRIENKAYGICRVTGKLIPKERLRSVPHATLGIEAKIGQSK